MMKQEERERERKNENKKNLTSEDFYSYEEFVSAEVPNGFFPILNDRDVFQQQEKFQEEKTAF